MRVSIRARTRRPAGGSDYACQDLSRPRRCTSSFIAAATWKGIVFMSPFLQRRWPTALLLLFAALLASSTASTRTTERRASAALSAVTAAHAIGSLPAAVQAAVSESIGRDRVPYHATRRGSAFHLGNTDQALEAEIDANGVVARTSGVRWSLTLAAYGRGGERTALPRVSPTAVANRVEYRRGPISEWYVNGPIGLEQGFTIEAPAPPADASGPLTLALVTSGDLTASVDADGRGLSLTDAAGRSTLRYGGLRAYDAARRELPARMSVDGTSVMLTVDDSAAQYPITVDPVLHQTILWPRTNGGYAFPSALAISSDTIVVGSSSEDSNAGAVYVYAKTADDWASATEIAKLTASDRQADDGFGTSVGIAGDIIVVGAPMKYNNGVAAGCVYVFTKPAGGWATATETARLSVTDLAPYDELGRAVAISGDTIVAGAIRKVYVFTRPASGWTSSTETRKLTAPASPVYFGSAVAIDGNTIVVGDYGQNYYGISSGLAYVYTRPANGWSQSGTRATLRPSSGVASDAFGYSVGVSGDTVVVGASGTDNGGTLYVFQKPATGWTTGVETTQLTATDAEPQYGASVGRSVAISGNTIVSGTFRAAFVFQKPSGPGWVTATETAKVLPWAVEGEDPSWFGMTVAMSGDTFVAGATNEWQGYGAVYVATVAPEVSLPAISEVLTTRASQASVDALAASVDARASQQSIDALSQSVNGLDVAIGGRASQASVDALGLSIAGLGAAIATRSSQATADALSGALASASGAIASRASQSSVDALAGSLTGIDAPVSSRASQATADAILAQVERCGGPTEDSVALRRAIERALADGRRIVSFYLPAALHGDLDLVRQIVDELIAAARAAGVDVGKALRELVQGDTAFTAGAYRDAYDAYARAYNWLTK
jgi:FG-GAP repeat protein